MRSKILLAAALAAIAAQPATAAGVATPAEAKALVEGLIEASHSHNMAAFTKLVEGNARIAMGPPDAMPPLYQRLDMRRFEDTLKGCTILSVSAGSKTTVSLETRCPGKKDRTSYFILRNGKVAIFYPFRPPAVLMAPPG